jgi:lactate racemase-like protein
VSDTGVRLDSDVRRVPVLAGSRIALVPVGDDDVVLAPPPPPEQVADVPASVRDALRFPLSGPTLEQAAPAGGRATIVVEHPALPYPEPQLDPRPQALAAAIDELERCGIRDERVTILVAGGLERRSGQRELERLLPPPRARSFRGRVLTHDAEHPELVPLVSAASLNRALVETDLVLTVGAAETVLHGGPGTLLAACDSATLRAVAGAESLVEAGGAPEWRRALEVEEALGRVVPVVGVSLVLDLPRLTGTYRGYPHDPETVKHAARSPFRRVFGRLPGFLRRDVLERQARRVAVIAAFGGSPSVAHAEALLRGVDLRGLRLDEPVDALVVGAPWMGQHLPRERANPVSAASSALGLALRLYRNAFPIRENGTVVVVHPLARSFEHGAGDPYSVMFNALRTARDGDEVDVAEASAGTDARSLDAYRAGEACHPLLPYADWAGCGPALSRIGRVVVAGCRDAIAARTLGFVPSHGIGSALEMAHGVAGGKARIGVLLAPPYAPILVG